MTTSKPSESFSQKWFLQLVSCCLGVAVFLAGHRTQAQDPKPVRLFDGRSFIGWEGDTDKVWRVQDGALVAGSLSETAPRNEFLATTKTYDDFDLTIKYRIEGDHRVNAGIQFRTKRIPNHHEVSGYQADIGPNVDGHLYDESRRSRMLAVPDPEVVARALRAVGDGGWHTYRIRAVEDRIQIWLNGVQTVDYREEDPAIDRSGIVAVQIHADMRAIIAYKDIEIVELGNRAQKKKLIQHQP